MYIFGKVKHSRIDFFGGFLKKQLFFPPWLVDLVLSVILSRSVDEVAQ